MTVISLAAEREARTPHLQGRAECIGCRHVWQAVAPVGTTLLECSACGLQKGAFAQPAMRGGMTFECFCGGSLFHIAPSAGPYCAKCGEKAEGW